MKSAKLKSSVVLWLIGALAIAAGLLTAPAYANAQATATPTAQSTPDGSTKDRPLLNPCTNQPFTTVMDGSGLKSANAQIGGSANNQYVIAFTLADNDQSHRFSAFTATHIQQPLAIVIDSQVLSAPTIQSALTTGGQITGNFTETEANTLAMQLRYAPLPIALHIESMQQDSQDQNVVHVILAPDSAAVSADQLVQTKQIIEQRLGDAVKTFVTSRTFGIFPVYGQFTVGVNARDTITVDLSNVNDPATFVKLVSQTGLLEFVDFSRTGTCSALFPYAGQYILTDLQMKRASVAGQ